MKYIVLRIDGDELNPRYHTFGPWTHGFKTPGEAYAFAEQQSERYPYIAVFERKATMCQFAKPKLLYDPPPRTKGKSTKANDKKGAGGKTTNP